MSESSFPSPKLSIKKQIAQAKQRLARALLRTVAARSLFAATFIFITAYWISIFPTFFHPEVYPSSWQLYGNLFLVMLFIVIVGTLLELTASVKAQNSATANHIQDPDIRKQLWGLRRAAAIYGYNILWAVVGMPVLFLHLHTLSLLDKLIYLSVVVGFVIIGARYRFAFKNKIFQTRLALIMRGIPQTAVGIHMFIVGRPTLPLAVIVTVVALGLLRLLSLWPEYELATDGKTRTYLGAAIKAELIGNLGSIIFVLGCWLFETLR